MRYQPKWETLKQLKLYEHPLDYNNPDESVVDIRLSTSRFYTARSIFPVTDEETPIAERPVGYEEHGQWRETIVTAMLAFISMETHSGPFDSPFYFSLPFMRIHSCLHV